MADLVIADSRSLADKEGLCLLPHAWFPYCDFVRQKAADLLAQAAETLKPAQMLRGTDRHYAAVFFSRPAWSIGALALLLSALPVRAAELDTGIAQRGPSTIIVGTMFTIASPAAMLISAARGQAVKLHACRFGHGVKMVAAGAILLPAGLLLSPLHLDSVPAAWLDGVVDAFQEDYCTRPCTAVMP